MAINWGIVGLPNVGKSTIFRSLTLAPAEAANYPFCTIEPNIGIVELEDERLAFLAQTFNPKKTIKATVEFVDIAGLVKGASKGEGLGNQFLSHIREVGVIAHVVRCFENENIIHVENRIDPIADIETINIELALADIATLEKKKEKVIRLAKVSKEEKKNSEYFLSAMEKIMPLLQDGKWAKEASLTEEENSAIYDSHLITMKKHLYICNVDDSSMKNGNKYSEKVVELAKKEGTHAVIMSGQFEADLADIENPEERLEFLKEAGLSCSSISILARHVYSLLGLRTFFTAGEDECRAWTIHAGDTAPKAAGVIHTDFEKGFIKACVYSFEDFKQYGSEQKIKEAGKYRLEGKEYVVQDGDVMFFKFNV